MTRRTYGVLAIATRHAALFQRLPAPALVSPLHATSERALAYRPTLCACRDPWNCTGGESGRASDGSHCREHLTPQLVEDQS